MRSIPARELRNDVSAVLRRVEAGEQFLITLHGRPIAELKPLTSRPTWRSWDEFFADSDRWQADPALARELAIMLSDTTEDVPWNEPRPD